MDTLAAIQITVVELPDGFFARFQRCDAPYQPEVVQRTTEWLLTQNELLRRERSRFGRGRRTSPGRYQDFFRALGYELDQIPAHSIVLDEMNDKLLLTYLYHDVRYGYQLMKRLVILGSDERQEFLTVAQGRRKR